MTVLQYLSQHGLDTLLVAIATIILTGLIKIPVKYLASKSVKSSKITRFITFLPIVIGFGLTALLMYFMENKVEFNQAFFARWLSAVSLSLAIYAFWEKFVPSEKKILSEAEIKVNQEAVEKLKSQLIDAGNVSETEIQQSEQKEEEQDANQKKIILTNNKN